MTGQPEDANTPLRTIHVGSPAALLAIVPHILGFVPEHSMVVIGLKPPRSTLAVVLRYDLPDPSDAASAADIARHAALILTGQRLVTAVAIGYGTDARVTPAARALVGRAARHGIDLYDILRAEDGRYWSYRCQNEACCPAEGVPFDDRADAQVMPEVGGLVFANRDALAASIAPLGDEMRESMQAATNRAAERARPVGSSSPRSKRQAIVREGMAAVHELITTYRAGGVFATDDQVAWLTVALREMRVRDDAWARMDTRYAGEHRRLWIDVVRRAQPGYVAPAASLLAFVAWQEGNGALANVALDRALADEPKYSMAKLLRQAINSGLPPSMARLSMTPEEVAVGYDEADEWLVEDDEDDSPVRKDDHEIP